MPAKSKQQQKFMGLVHAYKKGEVPASQVSKAVKDAAKSMSKKSVKKYAKTKHDDLPKKVSEEKIKAENLVIEFGKSFQKFTRAVHMLGKGITKMKGDKTDERIIQKAFKKHIIPFGRLIDDWNKGQQKNPGLTNEDKQKMELVVVKNLYEACQKGYMTHPTRKTKIMFGKRYRNCVKKEGIEDRMKDVMNKLAKSLKLKSVQKMATGSGGFSFFMDDEKESKKLAQMLKKHLKRVRIIKLDKQKGDPSDFVVAADMFGL